MKLLNIYLLQTPIILEFYAQRGRHITFTIVVANTSSDVINDLNYVDTFTTAQGRVLTFTTFSPLYQEPVDQLLKH